jgi:hypothetical protein
LEAGEAVSVAVFPCLRRRGGFADGQHRGRAQADILALVALTHDLGCADAAHIELRALLIAHHDGAAQIGLPAAIAYGVVTGPSDREFCAVNCHGADDGWLRVNVEFSLAIGFTQPINITAL